MNYFDAHIHLEKYTDTEIDQILRDPQLEGVLAVSMDLPSSERTLALKRRFPDKIRIACGFHPEQEAQEVEPLVRFIQAHADEIDAIGEIGLPYYLHQTNTQMGQSFHYLSYTEILRTFLQLAKDLDKPVILHAVYDDAARACDLLEEYGIRRAHFHWIKADPSTLKRMAEHQYYVSFTPDILYKKKTADIAAIYPLSLIMVETDGPWPFEGPFTGMKTTPTMLPEVIQHIAHLRQINPVELEAILLNNVKQFLSE
ncbi:TatD family hydrolase [Thermoflavimicrobium dichotomicum]|uniref:TatD DNase family protein n=1 Tax=Thermoflavimicrobium dichotomicum TaxID=46223 RepID=A0A1I3RLK9_9BACL|nr:TatD family hydrolase [Thermoflavimicrobium dichotomicum]SFJ46056.1 TatD DNase family protein [Thermoflavimicrobium dichotomicum]